MNRKYCLYQYSDGICGINRTVHKRHGVARTGHVFVTSNDCRKSKDCALASQHFGSCVTRAGGGV